MLFSNIFIFESISLKTYAQFVSGKILSNSMHWRLWSVHVSSYENSEKSLSKVFTKCPSQQGRWSGRCKSSQEVLVLRELILSTVSSATSASCISTSCWQLSLMTYTTRPTQMKMRRTMPITWGTKEWSKTLFSEHPQALCSFDFKKSVNKATLLD